MSKTNLLNNTRGKVFWDEEAERRHSSAKAEVERDLSDLP